MKKACASVGAGLGSVEPDLLDRFDAFAYERDFSRQRMIAVAMRLMLLTGQKGIDYVSVNWAKSVYIHERAERCA